MGVNTNSSHTATCSSSSCVKSGAQNTETVISYRCQRSRCSCSITVTTSCCIWNSSLTSSCEGHTNNGEVIGARIRSDDIICTSSRSYQIIKISCLRRCGSPFDRLGHSYTVVGDTSDSIITSRKYGSPKNSI